MRDKQLMAPQGCLWPTSYYTSCGAAPTQGRLCTHHLGQVLAHVGGGDVHGRDANACRQQGEYLHISPLQSLLGRRSANPMIADRGLRLPTDRGLRIVDMFNHT